MYRFLYYFANEILREEFGNLMLTSRVEEVDLETLPSPLLLKNKILLKVIHMLCC